MASDTATLEQRLRKALAEEYAARWPIYIQEARQRLGEQSVRLNLPILLRALRRAGLRLAEGRRE